MSQSNDGRIPARKPAGQARKQTASGRKPSSTGREDMTAEQRRELELRLAARQLRGKPPSI